MQITAIEPLGVDIALIDSLSAALTAAGHTFTYHTTRVTDTPTLIERGKDADIIIVANLPLRGEVLSACPKLKMLSVAFTGVDHIDLDTCRARGIAVSNASGYSTNAVAELAFGLMLSLARNILPCDGRARSAGTKDSLIGYELRGKTLGIVGTGAIGIRTAELGRAFGCKLLGWSRTRRPEAEALGLEYTELDTLLRESDIVSLHVPATAETAGLISREKLALMKPSALLINTARGTVVDNAALAEALHAGKLGGAGIDVFEIEPPIPADHPLAGAPRTVLTPHVAFASVEALEARAEITFDNITQWLNGTPVRVIC